MEAIAHPRQAERLAALESYGILDTEREAAFDDVARLAADICGTAIAVINLIDADRQWFKAEVGLGVRETPLATSICSHVILENEFTEISDTTKDSRFLDNPLCCGEPGLRFYAGALLKDDKGLPIGTLCVLDWKPRTLTSVQRNALRVLADQVMAQLNLRRALNLANMLRQEVDHRVKNSLQTISSVARLKARAADTDAARIAYENIGQRIETVAMLHEQLYNCEVGATVELGRYIDSIGTSLRGLAPPHVTLKISSISVTCSSRTAAAIGLLVNELTANAFKHAFPDDQPGQVSLGLGRTEDGRLCLSYSDNGVGIPEGASSSETGLGTKLVDVACKQLGGELIWTEVPRGVSLRIAFSLID